MTKENLSLITSIGNIFQDMGFDNADQYLAKVKLASRINDLIETRGLTQKEAGEILQLRQPKVSALINGDLDGFSMDRLFAFLARFDQNVQIIIKDKPKSSRKPAVLNIAFA